MLQILQAVNGLLLVWLLSVEDFAVYAVFTAAMGFASHMLGFGIAPTIISLVGMDFQDKEKVGRYLIDREPSGACHPLVFIAQNRPSCNLYRTSLGIVGRRELSQFADRSFLCSPADAWSCRHIVSMSRAW